MNSLARASFVFVVLTLVQGLRPQEVFSAEKFVCILGGTGTRHAIPVLTATFGLYPKYGLDATIVRIGSGTVATAALLGGEADIINTSGPALINARLAGTPVFYVTNFSDWSDAHLLVRPEVTSMEQLRSGKFAVRGWEEAMRTCCAPSFFPSTGLTRRQTADPLSRGYSLRCKRGREPSIRCGACLLRKLRGLSQKRTQGSRCA